MPATIGVLPVRSSSVFHQMKSSTSAATAERLGAEVQRSRSSNRSRAPRRWGTTVASLTRHRAQSGAESLRDGRHWGVHRDAPYDVSADLIELGRTPIAVVWCRRKSHPRSSIDARSGSRRASRSSDLAPTRCRASIRDRAACRSTCGEDSARSSGNHGIATPGGPTRRPHRGANSGRKEFGGAETAISQAASEAARLGILESRSHRSCCDVCRN